MATTHRMLLPLCCALLRLLPDSETDSSPISDHNKQHPLAEGKRHGLVPWWQFIGLLACYRGIIVQPNGRSRKVSSASAVETEESKTLPALLSCFLMQQARAAATPRDAARSGPSRVYASSQTES